MPAIFNKLNMKRQTEIPVFTAPEIFEPEMVALDNVAIRRNAQDVKEIAFALAFVTKQKEVNAIARSIARKATGDAIVWFAYPKGTSKKYKCDFNRDTGWAALGAAGFEGVRMVAIDEDWSALRFRRVEFIRTITRDNKRAITKQGKKKVTKKQ